MWRLFSTFSAVSMLWGFSRNNFFLSHHKCCVVGLHTRISSNWELFVVLLWREESGERKWNTRNCLTKVDQSHTRESGIWVIFVVLLFVIPLILLVSHLSLLDFGWWNPESQATWVRKMEFPGWIQRSNSYVLKSLNETKHVSNKLTNKAQITSESSPTHHTKERWNNFSIFSYHTFEEILV